jgi:DNA polymerase-3 subunit gamma/tau
MNLIAQRPGTWNEIVGQDRVVSLLKSLLTVGKFLPRGFVLKGPWGVGKTSVAYLLARALMCSGDDPLGCGKCPSCQSIDRDGIKHDPDFDETDAAEKPGVQDARDMLDRAAQPPTLGGRRAALVDEAHRLSKEAWDVFLGPLEEPDTDSVFMFVTTDEDRIPRTVQSRCLPLAFSRVPEATLTGLLASICARNGMEYETDGLRAIAGHSRGIVRDAVRWLGMAASLGKVTAQSAEAVLDDPLDALCLKTLFAIASGDQQAAAGLVDEAGRAAPPLKVVERLLSVYSRSPWAEAGSELSVVFSGLPNIRETDATFLRWLGAQSLPSDALPLLVYELVGIARVRRPPLPAKTSGNAFGDASSKAVLLGEVI